MDRLGTSPDISNLESAPTLEPEALDTVDRALVEDIGERDWTTESLFDDRARTVARIISRDDSATVAGAPLALLVFKRLDPGLSILAAVPEGTTVSSGAEILRVAGKTRAILSGERVALNFLARLSGIATVTRRVVDLLRATGIQVLDTRKTTPGLRALEKYAVRAGGGANHRSSLGESVLIKDNHLALLGARGIHRAVLAARERVPAGMRVEVEIDSLESLGEAFEARPDWILLDNFQPAHATLAASRRNASADSEVRRIRLEASGGIRPDNVRDWGSTGVDAVSLGWLTHSARAVDLSLEVFAP